MLGSALFKILSAFYNVIGIDKDNCDLTDKAKVIELLHGLKLDVCVHCAAYTDVDKAESEPQKAFLVNREGTLNILESINKDCLFTYISTDYVFDGSKDTAYTEADIPNPLNIYGKSKLEGERLVSHFNRYIILRTSWLFGPNGKNFVDTTVQSAKKKKILEVVNNQVGSPTYTMHLSKAIKDIIDIYFAKSLEYGIYHITNSGRCSWFEFAKHIVKLAHLNNKVMPISSDKMQRQAQRPNNSLLSNKKMHALLGYYLPSWQEAVKDYLQKYFPR